MRIYKKEELELVKEALLCGEIIAFPTDTVFGLGCIYDNEAAMEKIYQAKGRREDKPLPMMCADLAMLKEVAYINETGEKIAKAFMPGALTLILDKKEELPAFVTHGLKTIGIRIPDDEWILRLIKALGKPMLVTSANLSNQGSLMRFDDVFKSLDGRIDGIVEGDAAGSLASTIVTFNPELKILRQGAIEEKQLKDCLEEEK